MSIITYADLEQNDALAALTDEEIIEMEMADLDRDYDAEYEASLLCLN